MTTREKTTRSGKKVLLGIKKAEAGYVFTHRFFVTIDGQQHDGQLTSIEYVKREKLNSAYRHGYRGTPAIRTDVATITLTEDEMAWFRAEGNRPIDPWTSETDEETGITWYVPLLPVKPECAQYFERDVELDCPAGRGWNNAITLKFATREPEAVNAIMGWK